MLEFFDGGHSTLSFGTTTSNGFRADFERSGEGSDIVVFTVRQTEKDSMSVSSETSNHPAKRSHTVNLGAPSGGRSAEDLSSDTRPGSDEHQSGLGNSEQKLSEEKLSLQQVVKVGF